MPIYEYECTKGHTFELMVPISGPDPKVCVVDGCRSKTKRLLSASGFILKGSGWYATDYPSETRKQGWESESKAANGGTDNGHTCGSGCGHGGAPEGAPQAAAPKPEPAKKAPKIKNPYSGSRKKSKSPAKGKS